MRNRRNVCLCPGWGKDGRKENKRWEGDRNVCKRGISTVVLLFRVGRLKTSEKCCKLSILSLCSYWDWGVGRSTVFYKPVWNSSIIMQQVCWDEKQKHHSWCWVGPLGRGLNGTGAHSGVCSQPEVRESWTTKGHWQDLAGSIAGGKRRGQPGTLASEARKTHGDRETRSITAGQWVPGNAYEKTGTMPDDYSQPPLGTGEGWVPL